jgi:hypothetical protein
VVRLTVNDRHSISPTSRGATQCTVTRAGGRPGQPRARSNGPANGEAARCKGYQRRIDRARRATHLLRQRHALGYQVQLTDAAA